MSKSVYVAYPGFKQESIAEQALTDAILAIACKNRNLIAVPRTEKHTKGNIAVARLDGAKPQTISLSPYGLVFVQNPDKDLVEILFEVASILDAKVYSERLKPYASPEDWEKHTAEYRRQRTDSLEKHSKRRRMKILGWVVVVLLPLLLALYMGIANAA